VLKRKRFVFKRFIFCLESSVSHAPQKAAKRNLGRFPEPDRKVDLSRMRQILAAFLRVI